LSRPSNALPTLQWFFPTLSALVFSPSTALYVIARNEAIRYRNDIKSCSANAQNKSRSQRLTTPKAILHNASSIIVQKKLLVKELIIFFLNYNLRYVEIAATANAPTPRKPTLLPTHYECLSFVQSPSRRVCSFFWKIAKENPSKKQLLINGNLPKKSSAKRKLIRQSQS